MTADLDKLQSDFARVQGRRILSLFEDESRFDRFSARTDGLLLDYSKTNLDEMTLGHLLDVAQVAQLPDWRAAMFAGEKINHTENRAVLHTALRSRSQAPLVVDGADIRPEIAKTRADMERFANDLRSGRITGAMGDTFTDVVNIGIGGSDLGPMMVTQALGPYHDGPNLHFVSNVDGAHLADTLKRLSPATTLIVIASKTFTTIETMTNAKSAIAWLSGALGEKANTHLAAVSSDLEKTGQFGIDPARVFGFGDWVGGRYSLWGPVGLPVMIAVGPERFGQLLDGAAAMDRHFESAPLGENLPVLMALVGLWHRNICGYPTRAILPYDQRLSRLPAYLQQLDMESNGKQTTRSGERSVISTGPIVWGEAGTNGQHAFFQLLHQGSDIVPAEFLIAAKGHEPDLQEHHDLLKANCLAQSEALMTGRSFEAALEIAKAAGFDGAEAESQAAHRVFDGNRPSITLAYERLTPFVLGQIIALYEHRVFTEGVIWEINSFDQWGVELGKELATALLPIIRGAPDTQKDGSTRGLLAHLR